MPYGNYWIAECLYREMSDDWSVYLSVETLRAAGERHGICIIPAHRAASRPDRSGSTDAQTVSPGLFLQGSSVQAWGEPWTGHIGQTWMQPELFLNMARTLERACFDYILLEDSSYVGESFAARRRSTSRTPSRCRGRTRRWWRR